MWVVSDCHVRVGQSQGVNDGEVQADSDAFRSHSEQEAIVMISGLHGKSLPYLPAVPKVPCWAGIIRVSGDSALGASDRAGKPTPAHCWPQNRPGTETP